MGIKNHMIYSFFQDKLITKNEYEILFKDKEFWKNNISTTQLQEAIELMESYNNLDTAKDKKEFTKKQNSFLKTSHIEQFKVAIKKVIKLQENNESIYLSSICFPNYIEFNDLNISSDKNIDFSYCCFYDKINCYGIEFKGEISFNNSTFYKVSNFQNTVFHKKVYFRNCNFLDKSIFSSSTFYQEAFFENTSFKIADFQNSNFRSDINFKNCIFENVNFLNTNFNEDVDFSKSEFNGKSTSFTRCIFKSPNFANTIFNSEVSFRGIKCKKYANFRNIVFSHKVEFNQSKFEDNTSFENTQFENVYFFNTHFYKDVLFKDACSNKIVSFENMSSNVLDLTNSDFNSINFSDIKGEKFSTLDKKNLKNKETARIIKSHLESQHNIIDANKFFVIEQDKYYDELSWNSDFGNKFVVWLNKKISNHQTNWMKVLWWILCFSFVVLCFHNHIMVFENSFLENVNQAVELINPLNIFKNHKELYINQEFFEMLVRIITIYLFWQFSISFRQNTRRK